MKSRLERTSCLILCMLIAALGVSTSNEACAQRIVKNGGGLAELKVMYLHAQLATFLRPCLLAANPCGISNSEKLEFQKLVSHQLQESQASRIQFEALQPASQPFITTHREGEVISISNEALYLPTGSARPTGELFAILLAARWAHVSAASDTQLLVRTTEIFASMQEQVSQTSLVTSDPSLVFYLATLEFQGQRQQLFLAEDRSRTQDLTSFVNVALPCAQLADWNFVNPRHFEKAASSFVSFDASATCPTLTPLGARWTGTLVFEIVIQQDLVRADLSHASFRGSF